MLLRILPILSVSLCCASLFALMQRAAGGYLPQILIGAAYLSFCSWIYTRHAHKTRTLAPEAEADLLIVYASQTGTAQELAHKTAAAVRAWSKSVQVQSLNQLTTPRIQQTARILFIVSTTGEGDAPENGERFCRLVLNQAIDLSQLEYAILGLGDRHYAHFCAFAHTLAHSLEHAGARALFDLIEVDNSDVAALRHWQHHLGVLYGHTEFADWNLPDYANWTLTQRRLLNPHSLGAPVYHLELTPPADTLAWQAGDIAEIGPEYPPGMDTQNLPSQLQRLPHREYSIASLPSDGKLELLVRQMRRDDGSLGIGSGWLTEYATIGQAIAVKLRSNRQFHAPPGERPLILIGNGTGLAGLRAHIKQRVALRMQQNWLIFGERQAERDFFCQNEILAWQTQGYLPRLDLCFSRDQAERRYVQHVVLEQAEALSDWVAQGAAILVCGSLAGMAGEVHAALQKILGADQLETMQDDGLYLRDVY